MRKKSAEYRQTKYITNAEIGGGTYSGYRLGVSENICNLGVLILSFSFKIRIYPRLSKHNYPLESIYYIQPLIFRI